MVTVLPLQKDRIFITSGTIACPCIAHCEVDGDIKIKWADNSTVTYAMTAGEDRLIEDAKSVSIETGTHTVARLG